MTGLLPTVLAPLLVLLLALGIDTWIYADAKERLKQGNPAVFSFGSFKIDTPQAWFLGALLLWAVFFPLYLTATGRNPFR
ncbi:hypothetical protein [Streptosporangium sp. NPDC002524]|uniref:hypothetical protein n=1 Tax=Streptosporangium sp. NPDC002524 TaxID=3154537 RepID=UPI00332040DF